MIDFNTILYALLGGILPAILWLFFWIEEDKNNPEPNSRLLKVFLGGMAAVILVIPFQKGIQAIFPGFGTTTLFLWASIEEIFKFAAAYFIAIHTVDDNEPIDAMVYMITAALGFVALENALFILNPLLEADVLGGIITGQVRFIGASLLHVVSSAAIGVALALSFYKPKHDKIIWGISGLVIAILVHTAFNLFLLSNEGLGTFFIFGTVWLGISVLILFFEKVKRMNNLSTDISSIH